MARLTGGELLVKALADQGARYVFSIIGGQMCSVYDAVSERPDLELVTLRNETAVPIMASGYAAASGVPAVSMCTVGAGVVYEVAGLMDAWFNYLPVISVAPQVQSWKMKPHQENLQGCNQDEIFAPITKWHAIVYHWDRVPQMINRALREALADAPGPVHLDVPVDVLFKTGKLTQEKAAKITPPARNTRSRGGVPGEKEKVEAGSRSIAAAQRPVALIGQGMGRPGRHEKLRDRLNRLGLPALASITSSAAMSGADPAYCGLIATYAGDEDGMAILAEADLLLVIGVDPEIMDLIESMGAFSGDIVQVELDPSALNGLIPAGVRVNADPISFLDEIDLQEASWPDWMNKVKGAGKSAREKITAADPKHARLFEGLADSFTNKDRIVVDGVEPRAMAGAFFSASANKGLHIMNGKYLSGPGLPFAIGARLASPGYRTTLVTDRDALLRHLQELQTAVGLGLNMRVIVVGPGEGAAHDRLEAVLRGLGCSVNSLTPGEAPGDGEKSRPSFWLVKQS